MKISPVLVKILRNRGISSDEDIREFLSGLPQKTYDPFLLKDMEEGVDLILSYIRNGDDICIYGDYDTDGITSTSLLYTVLNAVIDDKKSRSSVFYYIPSRFTEGYGLNTAALRKIKEKGADLVVTVDCGSTSYDEVEYAKSIGLDVIVTDHHSVGEKKADCLMINPKQEDDRYPFSCLAGCGVTFKLAQALQKTVGFDKMIMLEQFDIVGIGTIGDIVPLIGENRTFAKYGIMQIRSGKRPGLQALYDSISLNKSKIDSDDISFNIVPNLNAAGRMDSALLGADLMLSSDKEKCGRLAEKIARLNRKRKSVQGTAFERCRKIVETHMADDDILFIRTDDILEGIAGIVAGQIKERFEKPTLLFTPAGIGQLKGTGRSAGRLDLYGTLAEASDVFVRFGGHKGACGFTIKEDDYDVLKDVVTKSVSRQIEEDEHLLDSDVQIDLMLDVKDIDINLLREIEKLEPFGCENPPPLVMIRDVEIRRPHRIGQNADSASFVAEGDDGSTVKCVLFKRADDYDDKLKEGMTVSVTGILKRNEWKGNVSVQFIVEDMV